MRYRASQKPDRRCPIRLMGRALAGSAAGSYAGRDRPESRRAGPPRIRLSEIRVIHCESRETDGSPRIGDALMKRGHGVGEHRIARLRRADGIRAQTVKKGRAPTDAAHTGPGAPNPLNRQCQVEQPTRVGAGALTSVWTPDGWLSLAVVLARYSRTVIGWAMGHRLPVDLAERALPMALTHRTAMAGLLPPSDRGRQYAARRYQQLLGEPGLTSRMRRTGNCGDHACVERFFGTLKRELVSPGRDAIRHEATQESFEYMEVFSARRRRHSTLGSYAPAEFEARTAVA